MGKTKTKLIDDSILGSNKKEPKKEIQKGHEGQVKTEDKDLLDSKLSLEKNDSEKNIKAKGPDAKSSIKRSNQRKIRSQRYQHVAAKVDRNKNYPINEAIELAKEVSYSKFISTLEAHLNTSSTGIRGLVTMPFTAGKKLTILAFGKDAKEAGADVDGNDETIEEILKGKINFDVLVTTPEWMPKIAKAARILGPRGLMPSPKNGTVTQNLAKMISDLKGGKSEYKSEPKGKVIHISIGKIDQPTLEITTNLKALYTAIGRSKIQKITISPTMGPGIKIDFNSLNK